MPDQTPLQSLVACGTKLWLDSVDPKEVAANRAFGATGATSNPIIIGDLIKTGRFDEPMSAFMKEGLDDKALAWRLTDMLVRQAQEVFLPVWESTKGDDGYVSFELDPLLEDVNSPMPVEERSKHYIALGKEWSRGHRNRMIKVPATPGGLGALEELAAAGVTLNVTLIFSERQYNAARDAIWRRAQRRPSLTGFKSVYSIFVSRLDVYTEKAVPELSPAAQGQVGIVNAKHIWRLNQQFWADKRLPIKQEMIFASTGDQEAGRPAVEVRRGLRRLRHRNEPAGHQRRRAEERPSLHAQRGQAAAEGGAGRDRRQGGHTKAGRNADAGRAAQVRRPATRAAEVDRVQAGGAEGQVIAGKRTEPRPQASGEGASASPRSLTVAAPRVNRGVAFTAAAIRGPALLLRSGGPGFR